MLISNPHPSCSVAHTNFNTLALHHGQRTQSQLVEDHASLSKESANFCRYSTQQMMSMDFEVKIISLTHEAKFGSCL